MLKLTKFITAQSLRGGEHSPRFQKLQCCKRANGRRSIPERSIYRTNATAFATVVATASATVTATVTAFATVTATVTATASADIAVIRWTQ
mmetsp:Transcript_13262/g.21713  ORF Transcript_13262/g.21713 Transcript_13262/m.21713 type:complete len:91 (-) Transcript_13262:1008-1280(-)